MGQVARSGNGRFREMHKVRTIMSEPIPRTSPEILYIPIEDGTVPMVDLDDYRNLEIQLAAKSAEVERLKAEINFAGALAKSLMPYQERAAKAEAENKRLMDDFSVLYAERRKLLAEREALRVDAERYRWLRDHMNQGANTPDGEGIVVCTDRPSKEPRYIGPLCWNLLDAAIDAARKP